MNVYGFVTGILEEIEVLSKLKDVLIGATVDYSRKAFNKQINYILPKIRKLCIFSLEYSTI